MEILDNNDEKIPPLECSLCEKTVTRGYIKIIVNGNEKIIFKETEYCCCIINNKYLEP